MKIEFLIPAKCTSSRVPHKAWRLLGGLPLVGWPIIHARTWFPEAAVHVATEFEPIQHYATALGCQLYPLDRQDLNDSRVGSDLFDEFCARSTADVCVLMQCTNPFTFERDVRNAIADPRPRLRSGWIGTEHTVKTGAMLSQHIPPETYLTGNFWINKRPGESTPRGIWTQAETVFACPMVSRFDINTPEDLREIEWMACHLSPASFAINGPESSGAILGTVRN